MSVKGLISATPVAYRNCQFLVIANRWLSREDGGEVYAAIEDAFSASTFGLFGDHHAGSLTKPTACHPMFILNVLPNEADGESRDLLQHTQQLCSLLTQITRRWLIGAGFDLRGGLRTLSGLSSSKNLPLGLSSIGGSDMSLNDPQLTNVGMALSASHDWSRVRHGTPRAMTIKPSIPEVREDRCLPNSLTPGIEADTSGSFSIINHRRRHLAFDSSRHYTNAAQAPIIACTPSWYKPDTRTLNRFEPHGVHASYGGSDSAHVVLKGATVVRQVDGKFILCKTLATDTDPGTLFIVDQHAASERVILESLLEELCLPGDPVQPDRKGLERRAIAATALVSPIVFAVNDHECETFQSRQAHFASWGIYYDIAKAPCDNGKQSGCKIIVKAVPTIITSQCMASHKLLIDLMKAEVWTITNSAATDHIPEQEPLPTWLSRLHSCPRRLLYLVNSRACRSAIMFNDVLSKTQCQDLMDQLAKTVFPKLCAHGRTSVVPLFRLDKDGLRLGSTTAVFMTDDRREEPHTSYASAYTSWQQQW